MGSAAPGSGQSVLYPASGIESQIRTLADYAFMLRDYETAKSMYSMVKEDFKADKVRHTCDSRSRRRCADKIRSTRWPHTPRHCATTLVP